MSTEIGNLSVRISTDTSGLDTGLQRAERGMSRFSASTVPAIKAMAAMGAAATAAGAALAMDFTRRGLAAIDAQAKLSRSLDGTIDGLRAVQEAGEDAGIAAAQVGSAMQRMHARLAEAARGSGTAADAMQMLGLSARDLLTMDVDERMAAIADRMHALGYSSAQAQDALRDLGIRNREMALLLTQGGDAIRSARQEVDDFGLSVSQVDAAKVEAANDAMRRLGRTLEVIQQQLAIGLAPYITEISNRFNQASADAGGFQSQIQTTVETSIERIGFLLDVIEGIRRAFMLAGQATAVAALSMQNAMLRTANIIIEGPTRAINAMIEQANRIKGIDIEMRQPIDLAQRMQWEIELSEAAVREGIADMNATLLEPMPSSGIEESLRRIRDISSDAANNVAAVQRPDGGDFSPIGMSDDQSGEQSDEELKRLHEHLQRRLNIIRESLMEESELETHRFMEKLEHLHEMREQELIGQEEHNELVRDLAEQHQQRLNEIEARAADERQRIQQEEARQRQAVVNGMMNNLVSLMNSGSKDMFNIGKVAAVAQALLAGREAIVSSYAAGARIGGPPLGAAYAATAAAATAAQIASVRSTTFGGGASTGGSTGGGGTSAISQGPQQPQQQPIGGTLTVEGVSSSALFSGDAVRELAEELIEFQRRGGQVTLA